MEAGERYEEVSCGLVVMGQVDPADITYGV